MYQFSGIESRHPIDPRVALCRAKEDFISAVSRNDIAIFKHTDQKGNYRTLQALGYNALAETTRYAQDVTVDGQNITTEYSIPEPLLQIITDAALILSRATQETKLSLTMGNIRNEKTHAHYTHTLTGAVINLGAQWEISHENFGQVQTEHCIHIPPNFMHRSKPIQKDEERFIWTLSNIHSR